jgi:hypothetical protein
MAGPGRPRKIQNEAEVVKDSVQELQGETGEEVAESPAVAPVDEQIVSGGKSAGETFSAVISNGKVEEIAVITVVNPGMGYTSEPRHPAQSLLEESEINGHGGKAEPDMNETAKQNGWEPIETVPHNGFPVRITDSPEKEGVIAFWRKSRAFANATHRWQETGFWTDSIAGTNINFVPKFWKDRYS